MKTVPTTLHASTAGFTLIELMVTVAILAVLLTIAAPSFRDAVLNARMTSLANDLMADLNVARSEAVRRDVRVFICTSDNGTTCTAGGWNAGWLAYPDLDNDGVKDANEAVLVARPGVRNGSSLTATGDLAGGGGSRQVMYRPSGAGNVGGAAVSFFLCDTRNTAAVGAQQAENKGRTIQISQTGRPVVTRRTCAGPTS